MEFVNKAELTVDDVVKHSGVISEASSEKRILPGKKSTICGDCTVVEDIPEPPIAPVDRLLVPGDIVEIKEEDESIFIIGTKEGKVTKITGLEVAKNLKVCLNKIVNAMCMFIR